MKQFSTTNIVPILIDNTIYRLNYLDGNMQKFKLLRFTEEPPFEQIVKLSKHYCARHNIRFVFIEPAIETVDTLEVME